MIFGFWFVFALGALFGWWVIPWMLMPVLQLLNGIKERVFRR